MTDKNTIFFKYTPTSCVQMCYERQGIVVINKHDGSIIVKMYTNIHFLVSIFVVLDEFNARYNMISRSRCPLYLKSVTEDKYCNFHNVLLEN